MTRLSRNPRGGVGLRVTVIGSAGKVPQELPFRQIYYRFGNDWSGDCWCRRGGGHTTSATVTSDGLRFRGVRSVPMLAVAAKQPLSWNDIEMQSALELPERETPQTVVVGCLAVCVGRITIRDVDVNVAAQVCAAV